MPKGEETVQVAFQRIVNGGPRHLVNRAFEVTTDQMDGDKSAWPPVERNPSLTRSRRVATFVLLYLLPGCDLLPAISGYLFPARGNSC